MSAEGTELEFLHKTSIEDIPVVLHPFQGKLLVGMGKTLRMYDYGKKKLLRKCENKVRITLSSICCRIFSK